ncbi:MAG: acetaldehyde dehydrogenase (acetylating) [Caulobacteraceae bacterium]
MSASGAGRKTPVAILGSGNIGTDLMIKVLRLSRSLELLAVVGIEPKSEGLAAARRLGLATTDEGIAGFLKMPEFAKVELVFDATSAAAHPRHDEILRARGKRLIDLTPAALGPYVVPVVNLSEHAGAPNLNMVSCGGQATIPIVAAVNSISQVRYAEIVASIASKSAGPGTRANIDEFTRTTAHGLEKVGGAAKAKAIIILNPAEPPMIMRDTVYTLTDQADEGAVAAAVEAMVEKVQAYVPGFRLKQEVQFERFGANRPLHIPGLGDLEGLKSSVFLEVEGAGHHLPKYAGNLDIMTSAALAAAERAAGLSAS